MKRVIFAIICLMPLVLAGISVDASVNKTRLSQTDRLEYTIRIRSNNRFDLSEPKAPEIELFSFVSTRSSSRSISTLSGLRSEREYIRTFTYSYIPLKVGSTQIPAQRIRVGNKVYSTNPISITVIKSSAPPSQGSSNALGGNAIVDPFASWQGGRMTGTTMILALPKRQTVYKGQPTIVSYYLYTDQMVRSFSLNNEQDFPGYGKSPFEQPNSLDYEVVNHQGKRFQRALIKQIVLSPNATGELRAPEITGSARIYEFGYMSQTVRSEDAWLDVLPLPEPQNIQGFTGAVGNFKLSYEISADEISLGEAVTLSLRISGRGNFNQFGNPSFPESDAQVSSPTSVDNLKAGIEGSRTLYYTIVPSEKGTYSLPALRFAWFDPALRSYREYSTQAQPIKVQSANVISYFSGLLDGGKAQTLRPMIARDMYPPYRNLMSRFWYWLLAALILGATGVGLYFSLLRIKRQREPEAYARLMADKVLQKFLRDSKTANNTDFYRIAESNLMRYLSQKYGIANGLSTPQKMELLANMNIPAGLITETQAFIDNCERHRFSPQQASADDIGRDILLLQSIVSAYSRLGGVK